MTTIAFTLSMPGVNSWDGKWSGDGDCYVIVKRFCGKKAAANAASILRCSRYSYSFGDGWCAAVAVADVDAKHARKLRARSRGFCGYDWMVESIMRHGVIQVEKTCKSYA